MAVEDLDDFLRQVRSHPEWREDLRRLVLTAELLELPQITARLAAVQARTAEQVLKLTERMDALTERMDALVQQVSEMAGHVEWLRGDAMERRFRERAAAYFGRIARRIHTLTSDELEDLLEKAVEAGAISEEQAQQLRLADAVVCGRRPDGEVFLVVEASWGVGLEDARRAKERADLLARTGLKALAVVAGTWITPDVKRAAPQMGIWQVEGGHLTPPDGIAA
ncbi:MAG: hypothetical protein ACT4OM_07730 [Actinomycetota bacterium]